MKTIVVMFAVLVFFLSGLLIIDYYSRAKQRSGILGIQSAVPIHWFMLHRKSNREFLYYGQPGNTEKSALIKSFAVKSGQPGKKPTPLPELTGRKYWRVVGKFEAADNPETGPYFLSFDTESGDGYPYGPVPYLECDGQCNWEVAGSFGLHGVAGNPERLADADPGSSGCVRHSDKDITYLYNLLDPANEEIRYYVKDI